ncbi:MAG: hypothetical protein PUF12_08340 [Thermoflexaceae bacterium]|nr:hypothetical protein [Thermoflexaceae bacterium]
MPHINRIRVNNVKYNFGTQFYDDFMMRFSCRNTIYDLANGGGKSVLMLLLLQNLIPNCTLDEKQPVEKLFRSPGGSNTIHSLIEWKLDSCYQRNNFKYMTTGFCARKGKDNTDEGTREAASIEYFNYCIFYREFGDNDIKNLPLSKDGERITYNGLKSYLRDLEKKDHGVEVYIFERKGDYQSFISQYGLFESEWEIIRGINKTEGHVRTYFENNYKTGRKVVEDLLIEEIIQKSFNNQIGNTSDEDSMAKTLLDIKDKIVELSRRKEEINTFDRQITLMQELSEKILSFREYQGEKEKLKDELLEKLAVCRKLTEDVEHSLEEDERKQKELEAEQQNEDKLISVAKIIDDQKELEKLKLLVEEFSAKIERLVSEEEEVNSRIRLAECMDSYDGIRKYESLKQEVLLAMDNRMRDSGELYEEIRTLAGEANVLVKKLSAEYEEKRKECEDNAQTLQNEYERVKRTKEETEIRLAVLDGKADAFMERISGLENQLKGLVSETGILMAEQAQEEKEKLLSAMDRQKEELQKQATTCEEKEERLYDIRKDIQELNSEIRVLEHDEKNLVKRQEKMGADSKKVSAISSVYGETDANRLTASIYKLYKDSIRRIADAELKISSMKEYISNLSEGRYMLDGRQYQEVEEYLFNTYGDDVLYGYQWYAQLTPAQQRDVAKRIPFLDYSFVVKGDFDRIREDMNLRNFSHSSYIVPIISEMILRDTRHAASADYIVFGTKDLSFLLDAGKVAAELDKVQNELYGKEEELKRLKLKQNVLWDDYLYMLGVSGTENRDILEELEKIRKKIQEYKEQSDERKKHQEVLEAELKQDKDLLLERKNSLNEKEQRLKQLEKVQEINEEISSFYSQRKDLTEEREKLKRLKEQYGQAEKNSHEKWQEALSRKENAQNEVTKLNRQWKETFEPYYSENYQKAESNYSYEQILVRFNGLLSVINNENADITDKKTLIKAYEDNIEKYKKDIEKRGYSVEEIEEKEKQEKDIRVEQGSLRERENAIREELTQLRRENESQNAQMNRMEGSLAHAKGIIEEKYGEFTIFECDNTGKFIEEHTNAMKAIKEKIAWLNKEMKKKTGQLGDLTVIDRDVERMLKNAGVTVPSEIKASGTVRMEDLEGYEIIQKDYDRLIRNEYRRKEEFLKDKRRITEQLKDCSAFDLADEVERSIEIPDNVAEIDNMTENIKETCECILLEKERVGKGIDDMERIKESFENRCIQTCCNIKAELDRLPKLSRITLDNEVISMIGLSVPYVQEEFYKERMAAYINDTVAFSESFKTDDERISYIKSRLSWKKLFSVIVTDMNAIRLNLYKRERIKDQSRYLRYEEAVGSTGQSQGIYIQFLIAIINYISNINAAGKEVSSIGKVVFIDNPFGAAKDIYIWEPIFKLLKTNHVQLIVPARGATPAITGRFDVNYILGQKMTGGRQQTVVVDYRSQVQNDEMEYTKLEYTQESMF